MPKRNADTVENAATRLAIRHVRRLTDAAELHPEAVERIALDNDADRFLTTRGLDEADQARFVATYLAEYSEVAEFAVRRAHARAALAAAQAREEEERQARADWAMVVQESERLARERAAAKAAESQRVPPIDLEPIDRWSKRSASPRPSAPVDWDVVLAIVMLAVPVTIAVIVFLAAHR